MASRDEDKRSPDAITRIAVGGFKSLRHKQAIDIRPLTLLAGANSSGKSSMMQVLLLLKQTLEATYDPGPLLIRGPNVEFTSNDQLLFHAAGDLRCDDIEFDLTTTDDQEASLVYRSTKKQGRASFDIHSQRFSLEGGEITLSPNLEAWEIAERLKQLKDYGPVKNVGFAIARSRCFLTVNAYSVLSERSRRSTIPIFLERTFIPPIEQVIHLPGLRGNPARTYQISAIGKSFPGTFENYVASVIAHWGATSSPELRELSDDLMSLGLTWKVEAKLVDDTQVEIRVGRLAKPKRGGAQDLVSVADVGFGVSQTLPVAVSLLAAESGQLVYIEQPEIHLHPRAQLAMAKLLAKAATRGVRVVAETHSSLLLLGVQSLIAQGELDPALVKLHWFLRDEDDGTTTVRSTDLDEAGRFGDWPEDFADVSLKAESGYLDAAEARLRNGVK